VNTPTEEPLRQLLDPPPPGPIATCGDGPLLVALTAQLTGPDRPWAVVGVPELGVLALHDAGLDLTQGMWVDAPGRHWATATATALDSVAVTLLRPPGPVPDRIARRIGAALRRTGARLLVAGPWPGAAATVQVTNSSWAGIDQGLLRRRRATVTRTGRGAPRSARDHGRCRRVRVVRLLFGRVKMERKRGLRAASVLRPSGEGVGQSSESAHARA
jgi:hypothetical protein